MRFHVDQSVSPWVASQLAQDGHDAVHVSQVGLRDATDQQNLEHAIRNEHIIVSVDTDFGKLVSSLLTGVPSVILFRRDSTNSPVKQIELLRANMATIAPELARRHRHGHWLQHSHSIVADQRRITNVFITLPRPSFPPWLGLSRGCRRT